MDSNILTRTKMFKRLPEANQPVAQPIEFLELRRMIWSLKVLILQFCCQDA